MANVVLRLLPVWVRSVLHMIRLCLIMCLCIVVILLI
nr:MAG TPA: hypothetical protein [Bacteriophage sp.]